MEKNKLKLFNVDLNQGDKESQWYLCTLFAQAMNLYYNCGIKINEQEIEKIAQKMINAKVLSLTGGAKVADSCLFLQDYLKNERKNDFEKIQFLQLNNRLHRKKIKEYLANEYAIISGILVNDTFRQDYKDGKVDGDLKKMRGEIGHFINYIRHEENGKLQSYILDNYFFQNKRENLIKVNIESCLDNIAQKTSMIYLLKKSFT